MAVAEQAPRRRSIDVHTGGWLTTSPSSARSAVVVEGEWPSPAGGVVFVPIEEGWAVA